MGIEHSKILEREEVAQGMMAFHLAKPGWFDFRPDRRLKSSRRARSPGEQRGAMSRILHCQRAMRVRIGVCHAYEGQRLTNALWQLPPAGAELDIDGPFARFTFATKTRRERVSSPVGLA